MEDHPPHDCVQAKSIHGLTGQLVVRVDVHSLDFTKQIPLLAAHHEKEKAIFLIYGFAMIGLEHHCIPDWQC